MFLTVMDENEVLEIVKKCKNKNSLDCNDIDMTFFFFRQLTESQCRLRPSRSTSLALLDSVEYITNSIDKTPYAWHIHRLKEI